MNTVAIITSRWNSVRLPGKALLPICGKALLQYIVDSARQVHDINDVVVATSVSSEPIIKHCKKHAISCYAGDEEDILDRLYQSAKLFNADVIVRLWGDCPLIEPEKIDFAVRYFEKVCPPYLTLETEEGSIAILQLDVLAKNWFNLHEPEDRHWIHNYLSQMDGAIKLNGDKTRFAVDTEEDFDRVKDVVNRSQGNNRLRTLE